MRVIVEPAFILTLFILFLTNEWQIVLFMLSSAFFHELGHIVTLRLFKIKIKALTLGLFGGTLHLENKLVGYGKEIIIALSGAGVNLILSLFFFLLLRRGFDYDLFFLFLSNLSYALFNLLPVYTLDGGRALLSLLLMKLDFYTAERLSRRISHLTLVLLSGASIFLISASGFNVSLFVLTILLYAEGTEGHIISGYPFCRRAS